MALDKDTVKKIASLAKLSISEDDMAQYQTDLSNILELVKQMEGCDTENIKVMTHPMDATMRLREDQVTAQNQRDALQASAPAVEKGLYLVPKVID